ncbi:hypothetical protein [Colwellia sp. 12G3]|uniref:hypothetical protein n=1 Tax=Colwellia sp. 12G3 TaxID=2058299 RepID=UPI000C322DFB|nr:hypothetical protein [Colwellia sp. 12G3]PKI16296.1 hypothetical protein CXF71_10050 [Colwellia sp. 12G3]
METHFVFTSSKGLIESAEYLLAHTEDNDALFNSNKYSFILVAAASLESLLNEGIISWAFQLFPKGDHKRHATAFLSMNLGKKLDALGFLLSSGKFITDNESNVYQTLISLIKLRNEVAHSKDFYKEADIEYGEIDEEGGRSFQLPYDISKLMDNHPLSLEQNKCQYIVESLKHLEAVLREEIEHSKTELFKAL